MEWNFGKWVAGDGGGGGWGRWVDDGGGGSDEIKIGILRHCQGKEKSTWSDIKRNGFRIHCHYRLVEIQGDQFYLMEIINLPCFEIKKLSGFL